MTQIGLKSKPVLAREELPANNPSITDIQSKLSDIQLRGKLTHKHNKILHYWQ